MKDKKKSFFHKRDKDAESLPEELRDQEPEKLEEEILWQDGAYPEEPLSGEEEAPARKRKPFRMGTGWLKAAKGIWTIPWTIFKVALGVAGTVLIICMVTGIVFACSLARYLQDDVMPYSSLEDNVQASIEQSSFIYSTDRETGEISLLQQIYAETDRQWASYDEFPDGLEKAAIAIEDKRFHEHAGVDWFRTGKACIQIFMGKSDFGGSTITQQFIKNFTEYDDVTVRRKITEIFQALEYEKTHTKEEIMENYLNMIYLGEGCYGVKSAARVYFGKELQDLTIAECASLISITNNPSLYDPYISQKRNRERQLLVLGEMRDQELITPAQYEEAVNQEMVFKNTSGSDEIFTCPNCGFEGSENQFDYDTTDEIDKCPACGHEFDLRPEEEDENQGYSYFVDAVINAVVYDLMDKDGAEHTYQNYQLYLQNVKKGGYHIYATIDTEAQAMVDEVYENKSNLPEDHSSQQLQSAAVIIDNETGDIVALAGGVGKKTGYLEQNRATQSTLQTGSSIKPVSVYAPAIDLGLITPATIMKDGPVYDKYPQNYYRTYSGYTNVLTGIQNSLNAVAAHTVELMGYEQSYYYAKEQFNLTSMVENDKALAPLSMGALTYGAKVSDMASAFAVFANDGVWREGRLYTKVYDSQGNLVLDNTQDSHEAISHKTSVYMNYMLQYICDTTYSGGVAKVDGITCAGKTGTTSDDKDRWFCGYNHYYTTAVWVGYDEPEQIVLDSRDTNPAAIMWNKVMTKLSEGKSDVALYDGSGMRTVSMCRDSGQYATAECQADVRGSRVLSALVFPEDYLNAKNCEKHVKVEYCEGGKAIANEYCKQFKDNTVSEKGMVKYTEEDLQYWEESCGIKIPEEVIFDEDNVCKVHTKEALEEQNKPTEPTEPTDPSALG